MHRPDPECSYCQDQRFVCEEHPATPWPHDDCAGPGEPCPICNSEPGERPELPDGWQSISTSRRATQKVR
jgi:hypothetical protein